jgi:hypothetical protein
MKYSCRQLVDIIRRSVKLSDFHLMLPFLQDATFRFEIQSRWDSYCFRAHNPSAAISFEKLTVHVSNQCYRICNACLGRQVRGARALSRCTDRPSCAVSSALTLILT